MRYDDPQLRALLAAEYVLGVMPSLARARFERLIADDPAIAQEVADWSERFAPLDMAAKPVAPPAHVWQAIERRIGGEAKPRQDPAAASRKFLNSLGFWRGLAGASAALAAALALFVILRPVPSPEVVAVLMDSAGAPAFIATRSGDGEQIAVTPVRPQTLEARKSFELWAIAGGVPKPLGLVPPAPGRGLEISSASVAGDDTVLAISLEPENGSPSGSPTGPVLFQGRVIAAAQ
jgi:anti-sigma-K factor RskA